MSGECPVPNLNCTPQNLSLIQVTQNGTADDKPGDGHIKVCTVDTQSIRNKTGDVAVHVLYNIFGSIGREKIIWFLWMAHKISISCHKINCCSSVIILKGTSNISPAVFNDEFGEYLQGVILSKEPHLITRDFDFQVDAAKFKDLFLEFWLQQQVNVPTDRDGHRLDLFITRISDNTTLDGAVASYYRSDHAFVVC